MICHGFSDRQVLAIADNIERKSRKAGFKVSHVEGRRSGDWVLMDYIDFVVHIFTEEKRKFYGLERLWGDAETVALDSLELPTVGEQDRPGASA